MGGGGITAAGVLVLLLALIGLAVGLYYAYICLRARPGRPRQHADCEDGPLIAIDPDVNGNHEDVPVEASAPADDESDAKSKLIPDDADKGKVIPNESKGPVDGTPNGPTKERETILVPIEEKPEPVKLIHENETAPVVNLVAPLGFVAPIPQDGTPVRIQTPRKEESAKQERAAPEIHHPINAPVPVFVPVCAVVGKKPVTDSDEEDGLLLQKYPPHDDSLEKETCPELSTAPLQEVPVQAVPAPIILSVKNDSPTESSELPNSQPETIPDKSEVTKPGTEPKTTHGEVTPEVAAPSAPSKEPEPAITVAPDYGWKAEVDPCLEECKDPVSDEGLKSTPQPVLMKEEVENLQPVQDVSDPPVVVVVSSPEASTVDDDVDRKVELDIDGMRKVDDQLVKEPEASSDAAPETNTDVPEEKIPEISADYPEVIYLETSKPHPSGEAAEVSNVSDDDVSSDRESSISSDHDENEHPEEISSEEIKAHVDGPAELAPKLTSDSKPQMTSDVPSTEASKDKIVEIPVDETVEIPVDETVKIPVDETVEIPKVVVTPVATTAEEEETQPELPVSQLESEVEIAAPGDAADVPLETADGICEVSPDVPLEAEGSYYSDSMDEGSLLEVIREEGSVDTESDTTDTETSEPEVTQYTFDSGPLVPSTSMILADEISSTLEPEVTKYSVISELEVSDHESESLEEEVERVKAVPVISNENGTDIIKGVVVTPPVKQDTPTVVDEKSPEVVTVIAGVPVSDEVESDVGSSETETESEGEAEPDVKEEIVAVPTASNQGTQSAPPLKESRLDVAHNVDSESSETDSEEEMEVEKESVAVPPVTAAAVPVASVPLAKETEMCDGDSVKNGRIPPKAQVTIVTCPDPSGTSLSNSSSLSSSSASDLSDDEVTSPNSKSKIPRLVERHGS